MCYGNYCVPSHNEEFQQGNLTKLENNEDIEQVCIHK